ncbi:MAG: hypothetical protein H6729_00125 [Deltaproteobacteria bacterium]|nr:hypothetical protein [Deltaproteobacteria bacterium]
MSRTGIIVGSAAAVSVAAGLGYYAYRVSKRVPEVAAPPPPTPIPSPSPTPEPGATPTPAPTPSGESEQRVGAWEGVKPLPTAADVQGDLETNWGSTPALYRPLFQYMEEVSRVPGSARVFSIISYGEARYSPTAHNGDGDTSRDKTERIQSQRAWESMQTRGYNATNTPFGPVAAGFGSGGLFGHLAPYFLATGAVSLGKSRAPLLRCDPRIIFVPRVAAFCGCVFLWRVDSNYDIRDIPDVKVAWASPSFLSNRGGDGYSRVHTKFQRHATEVGIDLSKLPSKLDTSAFPGVEVVFDKLVGTLPTLAEVG